MVVAHLHATQTIPITAMTLSFARRVSGEDYHVNEIELTLYIVCVSDLLVSEIKRIIKESEIMK
jgi:hypothetical protein